MLNASFESKQADTFAPKFERKDVDTASGEYVVEGPVTVVDVVEFSDHSGDLVELEEFVGEALEDWRQDPANHIARQFEELSDVYRERSDYQTFAWSRSIEEVESFVTRDATGDNIEEFYHIVDSYSPNNKDWHNRTYMVTIHRPEAEYRTTLRTNSETGQVDAINIYEDGRTEILDADMTDEVIEDYFYRSLIASERNHQRTELEKQAANDDARSKTEKSLYGTLKPPTTTLE